MPITVDIDVMLAKRKRFSCEVAECALVPHATSMPPATSR